MRRPAAVTEPGSWTEAPKGGRPILLLRVQKDLLRSNTLSGFEPCSFGWQPWSLLLGWPPTEKENNSYVFPLTHSFGEQKLSFLQLNLYLLGYTWGIKQAFRGIETVFWAKIGESCWGFDPPSDKFGWARLNGSNQLILLQKAEHW